MSATRASDMLIAIWSFCEPEDCEAFVSYLAIGGYLERASSAVEVGAPVSPEGAAVSASSGRPEGRKRLQVAREPINAAEPDAVQSKREEIGTERGVSPCVTAGETASNSPSAVAPAEPEATPSHPPASGNPFPDPLTPVVAKADQIRLLRPHCQHPDDLEKCGGSGRNHCHGCKKLMAESEAA